MSQLKRQFGAPMHHQLFAVLRHQIVSGKYAVGDLLPGEEALRETFDVSRTTVRRALLTLEQQGMIERRQGRGTRVAKLDATVSGVSSLETHISKIERLDATSMLRLHEYEYVRPPAQAKEALGLGADDRVLRIVRVRSQGEQPLWHLTNFLPEALGRRLDRALIERSTLFEALKQAGSPCHHAEELVGATLADPTIAGLLGINVGAPLLESSRLMMDVDDVPLSVQVTLIPPERRRLRIRVFADEGAALPAAGAPGLLSPGEAG